MSDDRRSRDADGLGTGPGDKVRARLHAAYALKDSEEARRLYSDWARDYEAEVLANGYVAPERAAEALAAHVEDKTAPVLDIGCGTGLAGAALAARGFTTIDGTDFSPEMIEVAREKGVYRDLFLSDLNDPIPVAPGQYANAIAVGVLSPQHAPPETLDAALSILPSGGCLALSLNDYALRHGGYAARLNEFLDAGGGILLHKEHGPHMTGADVESTIFVLRKF